ncbi:MAG: hypothetical protein ABH827_01490 [bacterium]
MQVSRKLVRHLFFVLSFFTLIFGSVFSMTSVTSQAALQSRINEIWSYDDWDSQVIDFNDALNEMVDTNPDATTQKVCFDALNKVYNLRIAQYSTALAKNINPDIDYLNVLFQTAQESNFLSPTQKTVISNFQQATEVESAVFEAKETDGYIPRVRKLSTVLPGAVKLEFAPVVQTFYFNKTTSVFDDRAGQDKAISYLLKFLQFAQTTPLLDADQQSKVKEYFEIVSLENRIRIALENVDFDAQLKDFTAIQRANAAKTFGKITQDIYAPAPILMFGKRLDKSVAQINLLLVYLTDAQKTPLLASAKQAEIAGMLSQMAPEQALINVYKLRDINAIITALNSYCDTYTQLGVSTTAQAFLFAILNVVFAQRGTGQISLLTSLRDLFNRVLGTMLVSDTQKTEITAKLSVLVQELIDAIVQDAIKQAIAGATYGAKLTALADVFDKQANKKIGDVTQKILNNVLVALFNNRVKTDLESLTSLEALLNKALTSPLLLAEQKTALTGMLATVGQDKKMLGVQTQLNTIVANPDYKIRLGLLKDYLGSLTGVVLDGPTQLVLSNMLRGQFDVRPKTDVAALELLRGLLEGLKDSPLLTQAFKLDIIGILLPTLIKEKAALDFQDRLSKIMAIADYKERLAALQAFINDLAGKILDPALSVLLSDALQKIYSDRPVGDVDVLAQLKALFDSIKDSAFITPALKAQINATLLPALNKEKEQFDIQNKLNDILTNPDYTYAQRLAALQVFLNELKGKGLSDTIKGLISDALQKMYNDRPKNDLDVLGQLQSLLTGLTASPLLTPSFLVNMGKTILPELVLDKQLADINKMLNGIIAGKDSVAGLGVLQNVLDKSKGLVLDPVTKDLLQQATNQLVSLRPQDSVSLGKLQNLLGQLKTGQLISIDQSVLDEVNKDKQAQDLRDRINAILAIADYAQRLAALKNIIDQLLGQTLPDDIKQLLARLIQQLYDARPKDNIAVLKSLEDLLNKLKDDTLLLDQFKIGINQIMLPGLVSDKAQAELKNALTLPGDAQKNMGTLKGLLDGSGGKVLDSDTQNLIDQLLNKIYTGRPTDAAGLGNLQSLLGQLKDNPIVSLDPAKLQDMTTVVGQEQLNKTIQEGVNGLLKMPVLSGSDYQNRLVDLQKYMQQVEGQQAGGQLIMPDTKTIIGNALQQLYTSRPKTDSAALGALSGVLDSAKLSSSIPENMKTSIVGTLLPSLAKEDVKIAAQQALTKPSDPVSNLGALQAIAQKIGQVSDLTTTDPKTQMLMAQLVDKSFKERPTDTAGLRDLSNMLDLLKDNPLIPLVQRQQITGSLIPVIAQEYGARNLQDQIVAALGQSTYLGKLQALDALSQQDTKAFIDLLDPSVKKLLSQALQDLYQARPLDPAVLGSLVTLFGRLQNSLLLTPEMQQNIKTSLLGSLVADRDKARGASAMPAITTSGLTQPGLSMADALGKKTADQSGLLSMPGAQAQDISGLPRIAQLTGLGQLGVAASTQDERAFESALAAAMAQLTTLQKIKAIFALLQSVGDKVFSSRIQNIYAQALQTLYNDRYVMSQVQQAQQVQPVKVPAKAKKAKVTKKLTKKLAQNKATRAQQQKIVVTQVTLSVVQKIELLDALINLLISSANSNTLSAGQIAYLKNNLIPALQREREQLVGTGAKIEQAMAQSSSAAKIAALQEVVTVGKDMPLGTVTSESLTKALENMVDVSGDIDPAAFAGLGTLLNQAVLGKLLDLEQKGYVLGTLLPSLGSVPTPAMIQVITQLPVLKQIDVLEALMQSAGMGVGTIDTATQNAYAQAIQQVGSRLLEMNAPTLLRYQQMLDAAAVSSALAPAQQVYIATQVAPTLVKTPTAEIVTQATQNQTISQQADAIDQIVANSKITKPDAAAKNAVASVLDAMLKNLDKVTLLERQDIFDTVRNALSAPSNILTSEQKQYFKNLLQTVAPVPTKERVISAVQGKTPGQQVIALQQIVGNSVGTKLDANAQDAVAIAIQNIVNNWSNLTEVEKQQALQVISNSVAADNNSISPEQKTYFAQILKTIAPAPGAKAKTKVTKVVAPTAQKVTKAVAGKTPAQQVVALQKIVGAGKASKLDAKAQVVVAQTLQNIVTNWTQLSPQEQETARQLLIEAVQDKNTSLSPAQKASFKQTIASVTVPATVASVAQVIANKTVAQQAGALKHIVRDGQFTKPDAATQNAIAQAMQEVINNIGSLTDQEKQEAIEMLASAVSADNNSISPEQKTYFAQILKTIAPAPTVHVINQAIVGKSLVQQIAAIKQIIEQGATSKFGVAQQNEIAKVLQKLSATVGATDVPALNALKKLLDQVQKADVLTKEQIAFVAQKMAPALQKKLRSAYYTKFEELQNIVNRPRETTLATGQRKIEKTIKEMFPLRPRDKKFELAKLENLLSKIGKTTLVSQEFKANVLAGMVEAAHKEVYLADDVAARQKAQVV